MKARQPGRPAHRERSQHRDCGTSCADAGTEKQAPPTMNKAAAPNRKGRNVSTKSDGIHLPVGPEAKTCGSRHWRKHASAPCRAFTAIGEIELMTEKVLIRQTTMESRQSIVGTRHLNGPTTIEASTPCTKQKHTLPPVRHHDCLPPAFRAAIRPIVTCKSGILFCGICHSDLHYARDEWHDVMPTVYPCVPGHEIVGKVVKVGSSVSKFKAGDLVGVGCLVDSDHTCPNCQAGLQQFCPNMVLTYGSPDRHQTAAVTYGGLLLQRGGGRRLCPQHPEQP